MKGKKWVRKVCTVAIGLTLFLAVDAWADVVPKGVYVDGQDLGGTDVEEAKQKVEAYVSQMSQQSVALEVAGTKVETTAKQLGFHWENTDALENAIEEYGSGDIIDRYLKQKDLENHPMDIQLEFKIDEGAVTDFVTTQCQPFVQEAIDASIVRENGAFVVTPSQNGISVDLDATISQLNEALKDGLKEPILVAAEVTETQPAKTTEMLSSIQDVLGTFSTDFSSSGASRSKNLQVGSGKINGAVLMPGETLSGYECMHPFTKANGYASAAAYENGQVVDSVGGGVCQIATTLYNAALLAEMEITQRQNHSMVVSYVKPSNDAAIAGTYKDIKITNPYDTPVYIEGGTSGKTLTFTIYGKETRPANRTIKYVSETLGVTDPGEPITNVDPSLQPGARVRVQAAHRGVRSRLWKYVYIDGVETETTILHTDTYNASKAIYRVGPEVPPAVPTEGMPAEGDLSAVNPTPDPGAVSPDPGAASPAPDPGAVNPAPDPGAASPAPDPGAVNPAPDPGAVNPAPDPGAASPAPDPAAGA